MEKRRLGRTGQMSSVAILGGAAFWDESQDSADAAIQLALDHGVNHIDVAPQYGKAEELIGPWIKTHRDKFFLGCKTLERQADAARAEMEVSLKKLNTDSFDLYQFHAVTSFSELNKVTDKGGALEAVIQAKEEGLTKHIGITGHGYDTPVVFQEALERFDFDTIMFGFNYVQFTIPEYRENAIKLLELCKQKDVGVMVIKSIARGPWGEKERIRNTWYEPYTEPEDIQNAVDFVLSHNVTGIPTAGDTRLLPLVLEACEKHKPMYPEEREALIASAAGQDPLFFKGQTF